MTLLLLLLLHQQHYTAVKKDRSSGETNISQKVSSLQLLN